MKTFIAIVVASTLFGVAVLGYRTMIHGSDHIPTDCAATILGTRCGDGFAPLPDAASHIGTVKAYTLAVSIAAMVIAVAWFVVRRLVEDIAMAHSPPRFAYDPAYSSHPYLLRTRRWLALREKRDPSAPFQGV